MQIVCKKCGHILKSLEIEKEKAWKELYELLGKHALRQHPKELNLLAQGVMKVSMALSVILTMNELAQVSENEDWILQHLGESEELVMLALGYDPEEEIEDEDEDGEEDEEGEDKVAEVIEMPPPDVA